MNRFAMSLLATWAIFSSAPSNAQVANAVPPAAAAAEACDRFAEVQNVRSGQGFVMVAVYTEEASFMRRPAFAFRVAAEGESVRVPLCAAQTHATVALMVFQDLNANGRLDMNVMGIPAEPFGSSGQVAAFGPPSWAAAQVAVPAAGAAAVVVKLSV